MANIVAAPVEKRKISAEAMASIMEFAPQDGFKLNSEILNQEYTVTDVNESEFGGRAVVTITLQNENHTVNLSLNALKKARTIGTEIPTGLNKFKENANIFLRSEAAEIWNASKYVHVAAGMKKDEELVIPDSIFLAAAVIAEDRETEEAAINPFLYKEFSKVVAHYNKNNEFPTMSDFREELAKPAASRIPGLNPDITVPTLFSYVKEKPEDYKHTLILKDFTRESE